MFVWQQSIIDKHANLYLYEAYSELEKVVACSHLLVQKIIVDYNQIEISATHKAFGGSISIFLCYHIWKEYKKYTRPGIKVASFIMKSVKARAEARAILNAMIYVVRLDSFKKKVFFFLCYYHKKGNHRFILEEKTPIYC